jgi:uncharacterized protein (DUF305 family)
MSRLREENQPSFKYAFGDTRARPGTIDARNTPWGYSYSGGMRFATAGMIAAVLLAVGLLTACGGSPDRHAAGSSANQTSEPANHNASDIAFARNMIPHHEQAVQMAQMVPTNTTNRQVIALANHIISTQLPEVQAFRAKLMQWPETQDTHDVRGHDGRGLPGMVDQATMAKLQSLNGAEFDRLWLTSMIAQHRGAVATAQDELAHGRDADVMYLARTIIADQQAEINQMQQILGG